MADNEKLGSTSPQVLLKNATNLDKLVNGRETESLPDRFGVLRRTWYGMEKIFSRFIDDITGRGESAVAAIGWQELGDWSIGLTVKSRNQIVGYNGAWYKYLGELEHVIAGDSPEDDGGVWSAENPDGKWSNIGDAALRDELGSVDGFKLIGHVPSYAELKNVTPSYAGQTIRLSAYYSGWASTALGIPYGRGEYVAISAEGLSDDGGFTCIPSAGGDLAWRLVVTDNLLPLENFGCIPDTTRFTDGTDCTSGMNACFATAVKYGLGVRGISTGQSTRNSTTFYLVSAPIIATGVHVIEGDIHLKVHSSTFDKTSYDYVFLLGDHNTNFTTIQNTLRFNTIYVYDADQRAIELNGIYLKYTNAHGTVLRGHYLNGHGVHVSPTYDSVFGIWSEVCGSVTKFAIRWDDNGDITNQLTIPDLLCHDSYHFGLGLFGALLNKSNFC